jgi:hypothetical protein
VGRKDRHPWISQTAPRATLSPTSRACWLPLASATGAPGVSKPPPKTRPPLREEHRRVFGTDPVSAHRQFRFRKIAWRLQADEEGWALDKLRELARAIARETP